MLFQKIFSNIYADTFQHKLQETRDTESGAGVFNPGVTAVNSHHAACHWWIIAAFCSSSGKWLGCIISSKNDWIAPSHWL